MSNRTKVTLAIIGVILAVIGGGSAYTMYIDNSTNIDNSQTNISGDTIFNSLFDPEKIAEAGLDLICDLDAIPEGYEAACDEWNED